MENLYENFLQERAEKQQRRALKPFDRTGVVNFSSNDYLGLSQHPALIKRAQTFAKEYGAGAGASRLVTGNLPVYETIENKIAKFKNKPAALVVASGFQANATLLPALFDKSVLKSDPLVFCDRLNHASLHQGCQAAGVSQIRYRHLDCDHLEQLLQKHASSDQPKFIITETVFSMDGDIADLARLVDLAKTHNAMLIVDEAHATGVLGAKGAGLAAAYTQDIAVVMGTFSKAFGGFGAYIACSENMKDYLVNKMAGVIYSTGLPPAVLGVIDAALDLVPEMDKERDHVRSLAGKFRFHLLEREFDFGLSETQIVPLITGDVQSCLELSAHLERTGILAVPIRPPTVPVLGARLRFSFSASHTQEDLNRLCAVIDGFETTQKVA